MDKDEEFDVTKWVDEMVESEEHLNEEIVVVQEENEVLDLINASLGQQICYEMDDENQMINIKHKNGFPHWAKITLISICIILCIILLLILTPGGRNLIWNVTTNYAYGKMSIDEGEDIVYQEVEDDVAAEEEVALYVPDEILNSNIKWNTNDLKSDGRFEEGIINILLLGEEAIDSGSGRGRTDLMIIATMNTKDKTMKLTSLMRDMLVQIPGYEDNKLNAAYEIGGVPLLYETIQSNFDIRMDGSAMVCFADFEGLIDKLGGVQISLTAEEASYLNKTNYISKPEYRRVVEGSQILNGNQALGYCRIRYVATGDDQHNDYGRTSRQRVLLNAIFEQYKSKSLVELALLCNDILPMIITDIEKEDFQSYLKTGVTMGLSEIENLRIPADHMFDESYVRKMSVLIPDLSANIEVLHNFIFGNTK